jgi:hypothetical protein
MSSDKVSRRDAIKMMAAAAAVVAAAPALGNIDFLKSQSTNKPAEQVNFGPDEEPMIVLVGKDKVRGFKGLQEYKIDDEGLKNSIWRAFSNAGVRAS